jgi:hypothetical protein
MNNSKKSTPLTTSLGGLLIFIGIVALALKSSYLIVFPSLIVGILITAYALVSNRKKG